MFNAQSKQDNEETQSCSEEKSSEEGDEEKSRQEKTRKGESCEEKDNEEGRPEENDQESSLLFKDQNWKAVQALHRRTLQEVFGSQEVIA